MTRAQYKSEIKPTKDTPYLALTGELWCIFCQNYGENWPSYNSTALYWTFVATHLLNVRQDAINSPGHKQLSSLNDIIEGRWASNIGLPLAPQRVSLDFCIWLPLQGPYCITLLNLEIDNDLRIIVSTTASPKLALTWKQTQILVKIPTFDKNRALTFTDHNWKLITPDWIARMISYQNVFT